MPWRFPHIDWKRPRTRKIVAVLALLVAAGVQYGLANIPVTVDVAQFSPLIVSAENELVIQGPAVNSRDGLLFSKTGDTNQILDVFFPKAKLAASTAAQVGASSELSSIKYITQEPSAKPSLKQNCHSSIAISLVDPTTATPEIRLYQFEGQSDSPYVEMEVKNAALAVSLDTDSDSPDHTLPACGYQKMLQLKSLQNNTGRSAQPWDMDIVQSLPPIQVMVGSDSSFRFFFRPLEKASSSRDSSAAMMPLDLGSPRIHFEDAPPFLAHAVWKASQSTGEARGNNVDFSARALSSQALLDISKLEISSDRIQLSLSGKAHVEVQGKEQTTDLWNKIKEVPLLERSLEGANGALLTWVGVVLFRKSTARSPSR